jgi:16S rRNA (guanine527-N7)-methyltransferase
VNLLAEGAQRLGIPLNDDQIRTFQIYYETLIAWNERVNLTRITDHDEVQIKHFLDSLSCMVTIKKVWDIPARGIDTRIRAIDVGSGGGFPGVVLKIAYPALTLTLLEATGKKAEFLDVLIKRLRLTDVTVLNARAEQVGQDPDHRERYDLALARALAAMPTLAELTLPLVRDGGLVIAQKGEEPTAETESARNAIATLGGQVHEIVAVEVPGLASARHLVTLKKISPTPSKYPRRPGMPGKRPLG